MKPAEMTVEVDCRDSAQTSPIFLVGRSIRSILVMSRRAMGYQLVTLQYSMFVFLIEVDIEPPFERPISAASAVAF